MDTRFAISEYLDAAQVTAQLDALIKKPIYSISPAALKKYEEEYFDKKCAKSKAMITEAREIIPGGVQGLVAVDAHDGAVSHIDLPGMALLEKADQAPDHLRMGAQAAGRGALEAGIHLQEDGQLGRVLMENPGNGIISHLGGGPALKNIYVRHCFTPLPVNLSGSVLPPCSECGQGAPASAGSPLHAPRR